MAVHNPFLESNIWLKLDHGLGLRGWGLLLYGTLPASLFALGILKLTAIEMRRSELWLPLFLLSITPVSVLFLLVRQRLAAWYLFEDGLLLRSAVVTLLILLVSTLIGLMAGLVTGKYLPFSFRVWLSLPAEERWLPYIESVLLAITALVGSSTLFLTAVKESGGLPALPATDVIQELKAARDALVGIQFSPIWKSGSEGVPQRLEDDLKNAREALGRLKQRASPALGTRQLYQELDESLAKLDAAIDQIKGSNAVWDKFFDSKTPGLGQEEEDMRAAIHKLPKVRFSG